MDKMPHITNLIDDLLSMAKGSIIKRTSIADKYETLESAQKFDYYLSTVKKNDNFWSYIKYPASILVDAGLTQEEAVLGNMSKNNIPIDKREIVLNKMREHVIENFEELNAYYRKLNGLPSIEDGNSAYVYIRISKYNIDKYAHELTDHDVMILKADGYYYKILNEHKDKRFEYLKYLGDRRIDIIDARLAKDFELLKVGEYKNENHKKMFIENYTIARQYILATMYHPESYSGHEYYDSFIGLCIIFQAILQCLSGNSDILIYKKYFDELTVKYILESYGLNMFNDIPLLYRKAIADNIENLIRFKGKDQVFFNIYEIFGLKDVSVFKYYIIKTHRRDSAGNHIVDLDENGKPIVNSMYDIGMVRVNINSNNTALDIMDNTNYIDYDELTEKDPYWGVYEEKSSVKDKLLNHNFNYIDSKYISINTIYDITKFTFEISYFMSMLIALKDYNSELKLYTKYSNEPILLFDLIVFLFALTGKLFGYDGNIPAEMSSIAAVYRFNFEYNIDTLKEIYDEYNSDIVDIDDIKLHKPSDLLTNNNQLLRFYFDNMEIRNILIDKLSKCKNIDDYMLVKDLLKYLTTSKQTSEVYRKSDGEIAETYMDYLRSSNPLLSNRVDELNIEDIRLEMSEVIYDMEAYLQSEETHRILTNLDSLDNKIEEYILKVISVFKSYTVHVADLSVSYMLTDPGINTFRIFDEFYRIEYSIGAGSHLRLGSEIYTNEEVFTGTNMSIRDEINIIEGGLE